MTKKFTLTIDETQAHALVNACEALARIGIGQIDTAVADNLHNIPEIDPLSIIDLSQAINVMKCQIGSPRVGRTFGPSIHNADVGNLSRTAWDIAQTVRQQLSKHGLPGGQGQVCTTSPIRAGDQPLPVIKEEHQ